MPAVSAAAPATKLRRPSGTPESTSPLYLCMDVSLPVWVRSVAGPSLAILRRDAEQELRHRVRAVEEGVAAAAWDVGAVAGIELPPVRRFVRQVDVHPSGQAVQHLVAGMIDHLALLRRMEIDDGGGQHVGRAHDADPHRLLFAHDLVEILPGAHQLRALRATFT